MKSLFEDLQFIIKFISFPILDQLAELLIYAERFSNHFCCINLLYDFFRLKRYVFEGFYKIYSQAYLIKLLIIIYTSHIMSWRQDNQSINQISKLRLQNTRLRIQFEKLRKQIQPQTQEAARLQQEISAYKEREAKVKNYLIRIGAILSYHQVTKYESIFDAFEALEKKTVEVRDRMGNLERELERMHRGSGDALIGFEKMQTKQKQLELTRKRYQQKQEQHRQLFQKHSTCIIELQHQSRQLQKKDSLLADLSHKLTQCEIQKKDLQAELQSTRSTNRGEVIKKECEQLLGQIMIKDDDYLKSYLLKNQRYQNSNNSISRRNKYDFIFQE